MRSGSAKGARLVLVGAGHAHLKLLRQSRRLQRQGFRILLVSPSVFRYSGLATGVLSGRLEPSEDKVDVARLGLQSGVEHLAQPAISVDRRARQVRLGDGCSVGYDLLSLNVGSVVPCDDLGGEPDGVWSAKPLESLFRLRRHIEAEVARTGSAPGIVVAGAGRTGLEVAAALASLVRRCGAVPDVTVVGDLDPPAEDPAPAAAWRRLQRHLAIAGVRGLADRVVEREDGVVRLRSGRLLPASCLVRATGLAGSPLVGGLGLETDAQGRLLVDATLRAPGDRRVFAVGDCAAVVGVRRPLLGVFGVRAAPVLAHNLVASHRPIGLRQFHPQRRWLSIMDLGDGFGFATRGRCWRLGRDALWLKTRLDRAFLRSLATPPGH